MGREHFLERGRITDVREKNDQSPAHRRSLKQEAELAQRGNGRLTVGSGNKKEKGDIAKYHGIFRVEAKCTTKKSFRVTREMIDKIEDASIPVGELPAIIIEFVDHDANPLQEVAVVPVHVLEALSRTETG